MEGSEKGTVSNWYEGGRQIVKLGQNFKLVKSRLLLVTHRFHTKNNVLNCKIVFVVIRNLVRMFSLVKIRLLPVTHLYIFTYRFRACAKTPRFMFQVVKISKNLVSVIEFYRLPVASFPHHHHWDQLVESG